MKKFKTSKWGGVVLSLCEIIVGILLLIDPVGFTTGIITCIGLVVAVLGVISIIGYFRSAPGEAALSQSLTRGLLEVIFGLFCVFKSEWFLATFPVLAVLYGVGTLVIGVAKVQLMMDMLRTKQKGWYWTAISAVVSILCAVVILCNPFTTTAVLWTFVAITLIVEAVVDVVVTIFMGKGNTAEA